LVELQRQRHLILTAQGRAFLWGIIMKLTVRQAINKNCKECIYDPQDKGTWIEQVEACTITICPFYEHRKLTGKTKAILKEKHLAALPQTERDLYLEKLEKQRAKMASLHNSGVL
jgi:hypothetical protein